MAPPSKLYNDDAITNSNDENLNNDRNSNDNKNPKRCEPQRLRRCMYDEEAPKWD